MAKALQVSTFQEANSDEVTENIFEKLIYSSIVLATEVSTLNLKCIPACVYSLILISPLWAIAHEECSGDNCHTQHILILSRTH